MPLKIHGDISMDSTYTGIYSVTLSPNENTFRLSSLTLAPPHTVADTRVWSSAKSRSCVAHAATLAPFSNRCASAACAAACSSARDQAACGAGLESSRCGSAGLASRRCRRRCCRASSRPKIRDHLSQESSVCIELTHIPHHDAAKARKLLAVLKSPCKGGARCVAGTCASVGGNAD